MINSHPGLPEFDYVKPASLQEASRFLAEHSGEARPFSGGTDCFVRMRDGFMKPRYMVDVKGLEGTRVLEYDPATGLTIGAAVPMNQVARCREAIECYPLLVEAVNSVASYQLRSRASIIGNICNASPAGDSIGACLVMGGVLNIHGVDGMRKQPLAGFFTGPGKTVLKPGDVVVSITIPQPPKGHGHSFVKLNRNKVGDLSIVAVTAYAYRTSEMASGYHFSVSLTSVAPTPLMVQSVTDLLGAGPITEETLSAAAQAAMDAATPIDDVRGTARYRKYMVRNLAHRALTEVWAQVK